MRQSWALQIAAWVAILAVFVALRVPFVRTPLERDEGAYAYIAQRALRGDVPYRDAFDHKPPGVYLIYATFFLTAGQSIESIHIGMYLWTLASMGLLYRLVSGRGGVGAGLVAALALGVMTIDPSFLGNAANTEIFMILPLLGAMLYLVPREGRPGAWRIMLAGVLGAAAFWIKPQAVTNIAFLGLWLVYVHFSEKPRRSWWRMAGDLGLLAVGGIVATAPVVAYFWLKGAWASFVYCVFTYNTIYATQASPPLELWPGIFWKYAFRPMIAALWPFMVLLVVGLVRLARLEWRDKVLFGGWLVFSFAGVCIGGYFRQHYFIQLLPAVAALVGLAVVWLVRWRAGKTAQFAKVAAGVGICGVLVLVPVMVNKDELFAGDPMLIARHNYGFNPFDSSVAIGREIKRNTSPEDTVLVIGSEPQILFYAERKSATRYILFYPLAAPPYEGLQQALDATRKEIEAARPKYIVDVGRISVSFLSSPQTNWKFFHGLYKMIDDEGYQLVSFYAAKDPGPDGKTFAVVDGQQVLNDEHQLKTRFTGVMVYRRSDTQ